MFRLLRYLVEFVAAFVGVAILLALLLAWRLRANPVSSDFLTPYIQTGIESIVPDGVTHLDSTLLTWNRSERAILVHIENLKISDSQGDEIANIPSFDAKISLLGLIFGQFMPKDLSIDHPQIKVKRLKNGGYSFGIMSVGGGAPSRQDPEALSVVVRNIFEHFSHALLIHRLAVMRAVIDVQDESTQKDWFVSVPEIAIERPAFAGFERATLTGHATVEVTQQNAIASVDLRYAYDPEKETHTLSTLFADVTPAFLAGGHPETLGLGAARFIDLPLTGKIKLTLDKDFAVDMIAAQVLISMPAMTKRRVI